MSVWRIRDVNVNGAVVGIVVDNVDPDKMGRIKVKFPVDAESAPETTWVRMSTPMGATFIIDPNQEWTLGAASLKSASDFSVFEGMRVKGRVVKTFVRGKLVAQDGQPVAQAPWGRFAPAA